jgi:hypothetical protein
VRALRLRVIGRGMEQADRFFARHCAKGGRVPGCATAPGD